VRLVSTDRQIWRGSHLLAEAQLVLVSATRGSHDMTGQDYAALVGPMLMGGKGKAAMRRFRRARVVVVLGLAGASLN
jgi:hypothetical protein